MEWMRVLVSEAGLLGATRALRLYEDFGWISPAVRSALLIADLLGQLQHVLLRFEARLQALDLPLLFI